VEGSVSTPGTTADRVQPAGLLGGTSAPSSWHVACLRVVQRTTWS